MNILIKKSYVFLFLLLFLIIVSPEKTHAEKLIYIPIDNRPVSLAYPVDIMTTAKFNVIVPPQELIAGSDHYGKPDELWEWLLKNAKSAKFAVISTDSLIYGGLVQSRTHNLSESIIKQRIDRLKNLKINFPQLKIYCFSSLLRTPRQSFGDVEPPYYEEYGSMLFRIGELTDKQEIYGIDGLDQVEINNLKKIIPETYLNDWFSRRQKNLQANLQLADLARKKFFYYYAIGKDDNDVLSQTHIETRKILNQTSDISSAHFQIIPGIDQIAMLLLTRAAHDANRKQPYVYTYYADGVGARTIPLYSDQTVGDSVSSQILASGALPTTDIERADLLLVVNTPFNGITREATHPQNLPYISQREKKLASDIEKLLKSKKSLAVADVAYANGADNGFMKELYLNNLIYRLTAYAGWNTADNTIGSSISQGLLSKFYSNSEQKHFLQVRLLDDWYYQANVKSQLTEYATEQNINIYKFPKQTKGIDQQLKYYMKAFNNEYSNLKINSYEVQLPWNRLFEVYAQINKK